MKTVILSGRGEENSGRNKTASTGGPWMALLTSSTHGRSAGRTFVVFVQLCGEVRKVGEDVRPATPQSTRFSCFPYAPSRVHLHVCLWLDRENQQ